MKKYGFFTQTAILLLVILASMQSADAQNRGVLAAAQRISGDRFAFSVRTQRGVNVYGVNRPSAAVLAAVDRGLSDLFAVARKNGYSKRLNYSDYSIFIARADRTQNSDGGYSPDIAVNAGQYAGSVYDKGGYIYAAGMVVSNEPCAFLIAEHSKEFNRISEVVRYEGEHLVLYHNDRRRYNATADHSKGGGHPILQ